MENTGKLKQLKQASVRALTVKAAIEQAKEYREALERKITALKESLLIEEMDVEDLKGVNVSTLLLKLRGKFGERKEQHETEALAVRLKLNEAEQELANAAGRMDSLCAEYENLTSLESDYEQLFELQMQRLIREGGSASRKAAELSENINRMKPQLEEMDKAMEAGGKMIESLDGAMESLKRAEEYKELEFGSRGIGDIKYDCLDDASDYVEKAKQQYDVFKAGAARAEIAQDNPVNTGFIVIDIMFENVIPNWYTEGKVDRAKTRIALIRSEVYCDVLMFRQLSDETKSALNSFEAQLDALVIGAEI